MILRTQSVQYLAIFAVLSSASPLLASGANEYSLGIEGFHDKYREPGPDVTTKTDYGSVTAKWMHSWDMLNQDKFLFGLDGRFSYGPDSSYKSPSGIADGAKEDEYDGRILTGFSLSRFLFGTLTPYTGIGLRYFEDNGKGIHTNLGAFAYDRRITQSYIPLGLTYKYVAPGGFTITPNFEFDPVIRGYVNLRLDNGGGFERVNGILYKSYNVTNDQNHNGYGLRGEVMAGWTVGNVTVLAGPFIRYWKFDNSDVTVDPNGNGWIEPKNTRTQIGGALKVLW